MYNGTLFFIRTRKILLSLRFLFFLEFEAQIVLILFLFVVPLINRKFLTFETTSSGKILQYFFYSTDEQLNSPNKRLSSKRSISFGGKNTNKTLTSVVCCLWGEDYHTINAAMQKIDFLCIIQSSLLTFIVLF